MFWKINKGAFYIVDSAELKTQCLNPGGVPKVDTWLLPLRMPTFDHFSLLVVLTRFPNPKIYRVCLLKSIAGGSGGLKQSTKQA